MMANHTSIAHLFERIQGQFDKLYEKRAFLDNYKKQPMFEDGFEEVRRAQSAQRRRRRLNHAGARMLGALEA